MKNIQIIDGADNCAYDVYALADDDFNACFPNDTDVAFSDDLMSRLGKRIYASTMKRLWSARQDKSLILGLHGTIFFGLEHKKKYYPTMKSKEMVSGY